MSEVKKRLEYHSRSSGIFFEFNRCLFKKKSTYQAIEVIENPYFGHVLFLDGLVQTTEKDEFFYHEMLAHPALVAHPDPQQVLIIGGGDGGVLKEVLRYPIKKAKLVEIDAQVIEVAQRYFPWLSSCLQDSRAEIITAEGKDFLQNSDRKYDVILVDSSEPVGPSVSLHEENFYQILKDCLAPKGIACTQVGSPFYQLEPIIKAKSFFDKFFKVVYLYLAPVPTYPGGIWCFAFLSDTVEPLSVRREAPSGLKYYNLDIHRAAFVLPNFLKKQME
ncbi:MAG: polyamine aminopropyltransferase [Candidatus Aminicenantes bacterium]|nr:polyamine aminopropyltransferase [Candidatus Aminicenantes bacterium]MDH5385595.1 polyamine aminopropyltransferase [Candidatus Aminicenantes bacterium]MDH5742127.1 polyamine aminopropyltransferase [Candidatus Aminicenantes bacterium]